MLNRVPTSNSPRSRSTAFGIHARELDAHTCVVAVEGELDLSTAPRLKWMLLDSLATGHEGLVLDLSLATFMDSTALSVLVAVNRGLDEHARLAIVSAHADVLKIFEFAGMERMFAIFATLEQALAYARADAARAG